MRDTANGSFRSPSKKAFGVALGVAVQAGVFTVAASNGSASGGGWEGTAVLHDVSGNQVGKVKFEGDEHGTVVKAELDGVTGGLDAYHGFHVHANDAGAQCNAAAALGPFTNVGGHWNPTAQDHGGHAGDLPSIQVLLDGSGSARSLTGRFSPAAIAGRAVIVHALPDNFGNIPSRYGSADTVTKATGDAGGRIACGIVVID